MNHECRKPNVERMTNSEFIPFALSYLFSQIKQKESLRKAGMQETFANPLLPVFLDSLAAFPAKVEAIATQLLQMAELSRAFVNPISTFLRHLNFDIRH